MPTLINYIPKSEAEHQLISKSDIDAVEKGCSIQTVMKFLILKESMKIMIK